MSNFNPNPIDPNRTNPDSVSPRRDVVQDERSLREQNIAVREQNNAIRENDSAATGLMLGVLLLGLAALGFGTYFLTQRPTVTPTQTIIREKTTTVPVQPSPPNINVTVPNPAPPNVNVVVPESAPSVAPSTKPSAVPSTAPQASPSSSAPQTAPVNP
jgi:hypothetical protein